MPFTARNAPIAPAPGAPRGRRATVSPVTPPSANTGNRAARAIAPQRIGPSGRAPGCDCGGEDRREERQCAPARRARTSSARSCAELVTSRRRRCGPRRGPTPAAQVPPGPGRRAPPLPGHHQRDPPLPAQPRHPLAAAPAARARRHGGTPRRTAQPAAPRPPPSRSGIAHRVGEQPERRQRARPRRRLDRAAPGRQASGPCPTSLVSSSLAERLAPVQHRIADAAARAGRQPGDVTPGGRLQDPRRARRCSTALEAGQTRFGENRVQEAAGKFPALRETHPGLRLHLIGGLQTNKARDAVRVADVIESVDRPRLADAFAAAIASSGGRTPALLVQVNVGDEPQKAGDPARGGRPLHRGLPAALRVGADRADVHPARRGRPGAAFRLAGRVRPPARRWRPCRWACPAISRPPSCTARPMCASAARFSAHVRACYSVPITIFKCIRNVVEMFEWFASLPR